MAAMARRLPLTSVSVPLRHVLIALCSLVAAVFAPNAHVGAEDLPAYDPRVENALSMLDLSPATNQLRSVLDSNHVDVHFVPMPPGLYARYSVGRPVIVIDDRWLDADEG